MIYSKVYKEGAGKLSDAHIEEAALEARLLLEFICGTDINTLYAHPDREVMDEDYVKYMQLVQKRTKHIPLSHITGERDFMGLTFKVNENVLIPRQDTEILVEEAMRYIDDGMSVLDLCTGSGCIILSIASYKNNLKCVGTDISEGALKVARENATALGFDVTFPNEISKGFTFFLEGDLYEALEFESVDFKLREMKFDVIVSNPPYIRTSDIETLAIEVKDHDPLIALSGGADGLDFYRRIIANAPLYLVSEGRIFLEIGHDQAKEVSKLLEEAGFTEVEVVKDYAGFDRVVKGRLK